jgi:Carboxypeptidase regulatory-like domain
VITPSFAGLTPAQINGVWTLRVLDGGAGDTGSVTAASITLTGSGTCGTPTSTPTSTPTAAPTATATSTPTATPTATPTVPYRNPAPICTNLGTQADLYPSPIIVAGGPVQIGAVRVTLFGLYHQLPDNLDVLLVGPGGQKYMLMGDSGGAIPISDTAPVTLTLTDTAGAVLPDSGPLVTGTFEPTTWEAAQSNFPAPAPVGPYNQPGSTVGGTGTQTLFGNYGLSNSNGTWNLYVRDDDGNLTAVTGCIGGGWGIEFLTSTASTNVEVSGRVLTADGRGLKNARVVMTDSQGVPRTVTTSSFGYYSFSDIRAGETYVVAVVSNRYTFAPRIVQVTDNITDMDFIAQE